MAGVWQFVKLILRRDRIKLPLWVFGLIAFFILMVPLLRDVYSTDEGFETIYQTFNVSSAAVMLTGPMEAPTFGAFMTIETLLWGGMAVVFMNTLFMVRHTRHNEEIGAQELLLSGRVSRTSNLVAALLVAFVANLALAIGMGAGLAAVESSWGAESAWLYGIGMGAFGFAWASLSAVVVQLVQSGRSANGMLAGIMGATFLIRGVGDFLGQVQASGMHVPAWYSWLSPFGWLQQLKPFTFPNWWPLIVPVVVSLVAVVAALAIHSRRDVGSGILPARVGRARASVLLKSHFGLTWHLQKNIFVGWAIGVFAMVATIGMLVPEMSGVYESNTNMKQMITAMGGDGAMIPTFLSAMLMITSLMVIAYAVQAIARMRSEESTGHLENILATKQSRICWLLKHVTVITLGSLLMLVMSGVVMALFVNGSAVDYTADVAEYALAGLSYMPVVLAFMGGYILLFGILPRLANVVAWLYFAFVAFMSWIGPLLQLDESILRLNVLHHLASPPANAIDWGILGVITAIAATMMLIGLLGWRRRDIAV